MHTLTIWVVVLGMAGHSSHQMTLEPGGSVMNSNTSELPYDCDEIPVSTHSPFMRVLSSRRIIREPPLA